jgi:outer membrane protein
MNFKHLLLTFMIILSGSVSNAQHQLKIGHVNIQELAQKHPVTDSISKVIDKEAKDLENLYGEMVEERDKKLKTFEEESAGYSDFVRREKEKELIGLAQKIQAFNQSAQQQLQQRNMELLRPVYDQINSEIKNIAGHNNFTYILDVSNGGVAYISPESEDITAQILEVFQK